MRVVVQDTLRNEQWVAYDGSAGFTVGRDPECNISLSASRFVSRVHLQIDRGEAGWEIRVDPKAREVRLDDRAIPAGGSAALKPVSQLRLAEYVLTFFQEEQQVRARETETDINELQREIHTAVLRRLELRRGAAATAVEASTEALERINAIIDDLLHTEFESRVFGSAMTRRRLMSSVYEDRLIAALSAVDQKQSLEIQRIETPGVNIALEEAADEFVRRLARRMQLGMTGETAQGDVEKVNTRLRDFLPAIIEETPDNVQFYLLGRLVKKTICDMIFGLGPLQDLLDTPSISEIMIVSPELVYVERGGKIIKSNRTFLGDEALVSVIERIVAPLGRRIDRSSPLVDARLKDGSRVNAVIPPLALKGSCLTIRRFSKRRLTHEDLIRFGAATPAAFALLEACVRNYKNVVVAGGTGSGKTTLLNVLSSFIPEEDRVITIEDAAELQLDQEHVVSLETRPPNVEGKGAYTIRDLVKNALRMRPDRIIVGECRGAETFDMLQAMNTGHAGSMTTLHANSAQDAIARVETMCLMAIEIPLQALRRQVSQAIDVLVYVQRLKSGARKITQITEVLGLHPLTGEIESRDVMALAGPPGKESIKPTGYMPTFMGDLVDRNLIDLDRWFGDAA
ncbi:MAG: ATPase, T2SS/T4P/T4SS family [Planctomycetota bacterium]|nr:ATPase, T2SS/T4P/T4SS family [Planctomycetota bacterium]